MSAGGPGPAGAASGGATHLAVDGVRFLLEIASLVAVAAWGVHVAHATALKVLLAVALPLTVAAAWGRFAAPRSTHRMSGRGLLAIEVIVFGGAALAIVGIGAPLLGLVFAAVAAVDTALVHRRQGGSPDAQHAREL